MISTYNLKTKYIFGKDSIKGLSKIICSKHKNVLILYGGGSIKRNGVYDQLTEELRKIKGLNIFEFNGIEPNPRHTTVNKAGLFCRKNNIDLIIAVGGGSVIDSSKVIGVLATNENINDSWDYVMDPSIAKNKCLPIIAILTISGTGSENNAGSVITNTDISAKNGVFTESGIPKYAILDPTYTNTLSKWQLSSGIFDCFSHLLEQYYGKQTFDWTKNIIIANMKTLLNAVNTIYTKDFYDYNARSNLMWTASMSLNSTTSFNSDGDWNVHGIEHSISALWDVTHGAGLALVTPTYIKYRSMKEDWFKDKTLYLAKEIFNVNSLEYFNEKLIELIKLLELPLKYTDFEEVKNVTDENLKYIVEHSIKYRCTLDPKDITEIVNKIPK